MKTIDDILNIRRNRYHFNNLLKAHSVVPFIGAGMSSDIYPMWFDFLNQFDLLSDERMHLDCLINTGQFEEAASYIYATSKEMFISTVKDVFSPSRLDGKEFSPSLKMLPKITDGVVLTTNIDEVLENVWQHEGQRFDAVIMPDCEDQFNQAITDGSHILIKLHGTVAESSKYVLTKEQYDKYYGVISNDIVDFQKPFPRNLGRLIQSKTLLFMGCSLKNDRILHILNQIAGWNEYINHYALLSLADDEEENIVRERELGKYGIFPIWFPNKDYDCIEVILYELSRSKKKEMKV